MAQTVSRIILSGSTNGLGIQVTGTSSAADVTLHTAVSGTTSYDLLTLWAVNEDADGERRTLTVAFGGETAPNIFTVPVDAKVGQVLICDSIPLRNSLVVGAWADEANDCVVYGSVLRVTES
jgi:hypothetical protein